MSWEVENKAHNDKPLYAMACRIGVVNAGSSGKVYLSALCTFTGLFQHGGRPLRYVGEDSYRKMLAPESVKAMFLLGLTHRPGFLVNSCELTGPVHLIALSVVEQYRLPVTGLESLRVENPALQTGTQLGVCNFAGRPEPVCIPLKIRQRHTHLIGRSGTGKTTLQEQIILSDIDQGYGVAVLDPHGDMAERLLCLIPEACVDRTIYLNPGDAQWVPIWNPLKPVPGQDAGRMAEDIVMAIKSFVASGGWGDRLEYILRNIIISLIGLGQGASFLDISSLLRNTSRENEHLVARILQTVDSEEIRRFWIHDYKRYKKDDLGPPKNKLGKLLSSGTVSLMLSQPESRFDFRTIMDKGMILIINLSQIATKVREVLGSFILSMLHLTALSRSDLPIEDRRQFHIHCDEAHRFMTDALEDLIAETRKYNVSLTLSHQYLSQFDKEKRDAFSTMGTTVIFNVDSSDARYLLKDLRNLVKVEDLLKLEVGQAVARIGTDVVRFETLKPLSPSGENFKDRIISESYRKYYRPVHEVRKWIQDRRRGIGIPLPPIARSDQPVEEFIYDEF